MSGSRWNLNIPFPGLESDEFRAAIYDLESTISALTLVVDQTRVDDFSPLAFDNVLAGLDSALTQMTLIETYVSCHLFVHESTLPQHDEMLKLQARLNQLIRRTIQMIGPLNIDALVAQSTLAQVHEPLLRYVQQKSHHLALRTELHAPESGTSGSEWVQIYRQLAAQTTMTLNLDDEVQIIPVSASQHFAAHPDRNVRRHALQAEIAAWEGNAETFASALNGIKSEARTLSRRNGWPSPLEQSIFENRIDRQTLDAMWDAVRSALPDFHRYLNAKATTLHVSELAWFDLHAPVGVEQADWTYAAAQDFIIEHFTGYSDRLGQLASRAFDEGWIDAEPRAGKPGYGLTMPLQSGESRIMANFTPTWFGVRQLAHELGHAYHIWIMAQANRSMLQQYWTPWTLAETASIFAETIIREAAQRQAQPDQKLAVLDASLQQTRRILDHYAAFRFEKQVFEQRKKRDLGADDFNQLMQSSQKEAYGNAVDTDTLNPYMWAALPHFYNSESSFNNYPYTFGLLFSLGLYAVYEQDAEWFRPAFHEMLSLTGLLPAHDLATRFGIDLSSPDFWYGSIDTIRRDIDEFERLAAL